MCVTDMCVCVCLSEIESKRRNVFACLLNKDMVAVSYMCEFVRACKR